MKLQIFDSFGRELRKLGSADSAMKKAPLPDPVEAGYAPPNPNQSRKNCGNCYKLSTNGSCSEVAGEIVSNGMCSYHVFGTPHDQGGCLQTGQKMDQKTAGYVVLKTVDGTSCDVCIAYHGDAKGGRCHAVQSKGEPATVEPRGCCNRWHNSQES